MPNNATNSNTVKNDVIMTEIVMPQHTNPVGVIFGGVVMSWIDIASAIAASRHSKMHVTTASIDALDFIKPIHLGWVVNIRASVNRVWNTSMEIGVQVSAENPRSGELYHTATAYLTMVAIDDAGKPHKVSDVAVNSDDEKRRHRQAGERRALRLAAKKLRQQDSAHSSFAS
jgi:acyl-CoA hydrolase